MDINKILNLHQSYTQAQVKNLNKEILGAQYAQLGQLQALQNEIARADATSRKILEVQLKEAQEKEEQKYYKGISYKAKEAILYISSISNNLMRYLLIDIYKDSLFAILNDAKEHLIEFHDKDFVSEITQKLQVLEDEMQKNLTEYKSSNYSKMLELNRVYSKLRREKWEEDNKKALLDMTKPKVKTPKKKVLKEKKEEELKPRVDSGRVGCMKFSVLLIIAIIYYIASDWHGAGSWTDHLFLIMVCVFLVLSFIVYFTEERKWRKNYDSYVKEYNERKALNEELKKKEIELETTDMEEQIVDPEETAFQNYQHVKKMVLEDYANLENDIEKVASFLPMEPRKPIDSVAYNTAVEYVNKQKVPNRRKMELWNRKIVWRLEEFHVIQGYKVLIANKNLLDRFWEINNLPR